MEPVSVGLLLALAGGAGGAVGQQVWNGLSALVRRPFKHSSDNAISASPGTDELMELRQAPAGREVAARLAGVLQARADADAEFKTALQVWQTRAQAAFPTSGNVHNQISGGTQYGPVLQGRDFSNITFGASAPAPSSPDSI